ncbi:conserved hypothetical protein [Leishmania infantum JPCM5]|uniref:Uncharacterized protein n=2 Tax=Leishmania infantum TaxID=5671 RepID=A4IB23_LEIIN|nr:conserved hypothetical protein [Leishmania infantum JPCM5]CAC9543732.1 hypothetical_protein_-_conserved [Leishmania infantum]CAM72037.1 conserved hypothetical protein [Leishmania infantum JPCM5]SUZ45958.1 hypothetical_protein_-_conserved [Leishmania infantum]|eukprot:XP_001468942.1 conserved hypothetical protein [Leishmania infantum JPCM5]
MTVSPSAAATAAPTIFIRCATLHSRGELLNGFFFAHRATLGIQDWYETARTPVSGGTGNEEEKLSSAEDSAAAGDTPHTALSPRLPPHFPVEVLYVRNSRKPYFLVEWRYPTSEEEGKRKDPSDGSSGVKEGVTEVHEARAGSSQNRVTEEFLRQLAERTLALGKQELSDDGATWKGQPVFISAALPGMTVVAERRKLELRAAQLTIQRATEKRERAEDDSAAQTAKTKQRDSGVVTSAFIPRCVRRRT